MKNCRIALAIGAGFGCFIGICLIPLFCYCCIGLTCDGPRAEGNFARH